MERLRRAWNIAGVPVKVKTSLSAASETWLLPPPRLQLESFRCDDASRRDAYPWITSITASTDRCINSCCGAAAAPPVAQGKKISITIFTTATEIIAETMSATVGFIWTCMMCPRYWYGNDSDDRTSMIHGNRDFHSGNKLAGARVHLHMDDVPQVLVEHVDGVGRRQVGGDTLRPVGAGRTGVSVTDHLGPKGPNRTGPRVTQVGWLGRV